MPRLRANEEPHRASPVGDRACNGLQPDLRHLVDLDREYVRRQAAAVPRQIIINSTPQEARVATMENARLLEIQLERVRERSMVGSICKGRVSRVLPGMQAAFVDIGLDKAAFLPGADFFPLSADEYALAEQSFDAADALRMGLVNRIVPDDEVEQEASATAERIAEGAPLVARWHKKFTRRLMRPEPLADAEMDESFHCFETEDFRTGYRAFLAKTKPVFQGR